MPAPEMFPPARILRKITLECDDLTSDLIDGVRVTLKVEFTDEMRATILSRVLDGELAGDLPDHARSLVEAFLWGEGPKAVIAWAQSLDRSAMSRRVRSTL